MKLKLKHLNIGAGRPIILVHSLDARKMNVHISDRLELRYKGKKIIAPADVLDDFLKPGEVALSEEVIDYIKPSRGSLVEINLALEPLSSQYISKKLNGKELSREEIFSIITDIINNALTEAEISCFISAVYTRGMNLKETIFLTEAISTTGKILVWDSKIVADKHCIGGIPGNRTTPIVVSICAAAGLTMPKSSSRAITSPAGTADTMETVSHVDLSVEKLRSVVKKTGACLAWGGSLGLAPADDKLIRIERMLNLDPEAQLIASILSKKIAAGSTHILIDIPFGGGAKVSKKEGLSLTEKFKKVGSHFGLKIETVLTDGSQPIGNGIGPSLEIQDVIKVLKQENSPLDLEEKSLFLAGKILEMTGKAKSGKGYSLAKSILISGEAYKKFDQIISLQGKRGGPCFSKFNGDIIANKSFKIKNIDNSKISLLARILGCPIDKCSGIYLFKHVGDNVKKGEKIMTFYSESSKKLQEAIDFANSSNPII